MSSKNFIQRYVPKAFLTANISFQKLQNPKVKTLFAEMCGRTVPNESTLHKSYVNDFACKQLEKTNHLTILRLVSF